VVRKQEVSMRARSLLVDLAFPLLVSVLVTSVLAGGSPSGKVAIHVKAHGTPCGANFPVFTTCSDIRTSYQGCDEIDAVVVFFNLTEYTAVEFGLMWPQQWASGTWVQCNGDAVSGYIEMPGDGILISWSTCQRTWAAAPGYAWLLAATPGWITIVRDPATAFVGTTDCSSSPGPQQHWVLGTCAAGACGRFGSNPCYEAIEPATWGTIKGMFR